LLYSQTHLVFPHRSSPWVGGLRLGVRLSLASFLFGVELARFLLFAE
jgi:hypothetical protein